LFDLNADSVVNFRLVLQLFCTFIQRSVRIVTAGQMSTHRLWVQAKVNRKLWPCGGM